MLLLFSGPVVSYSLRLHGLQCARPLCPSPSPGVCPSSCPLHQWCHPSISSSDALLFFCPQSFPTSGTFPLRPLVLQLAAPTLTHILSPTLPPAGALQERHLSHWLEIFNSSLKRWSRRCGRRGSCRYFHQKRFELWSCETQVQRQTFVAASHETLDKLP